MIIYNDTSNDYDNDIPLMILYDNTLMMFKISYIIVIHMNYDPFMIMYD